MTEEINQADELKEKVYVVLVKINQVLNAASTAGESAPASGSLSTDTSLSTQGGSHVKLPKLSIQPFRGELMTWTPFWESYCAAIHNHTGLTGIVHIVVVTQFTVSCHIHVLCTLKIPCVKFFLPGNWCGT